MSEIKMREVYETIFIAILTRHGFYYNKPLRVQWSAKDNGWRDFKDKLLVKKLGLSISKNSVSYSSPDRNKVLSWMLGIRCCNYMTKTSPMVVYSNLDLEFRKSKKDEFQEEYNAEDYLTTAKL